MDSNGTNVLKFPVNKENDSAFANILGITSELIAAFERIPVRKRMVAIDVLISKTRLHEKKSMEESNIDLALSVVKGNLDYIDDKERLIKELRGRIREKKKFLSN